MSPHPTSWKSILILSTHLRLGLLGFPTKTLYRPLLSTIRVACPALLILLDLITRLLSLLQILPYRSGRDACNEKHSKGSTERGYKRRPCCQTQIPLTIVGRLCPLEIQHPLEPVSQILRLTFATAIMLPSMESGRICPSSRKPSLC